jgi:hypothetical protein
LHHQTKRPTPYRVGLFLRTAAYCRVLARVRGGSCGLRGFPRAPGFGRFHSLRAIFLSGLAVRWRPKSTSTPNFRVTNQQLTRGPIKRLIRGIGRRWKQQRHVQRAENSGSVTGWRSATDQLLTLSVAGPSVCPVAGAAIEELVEAPSRRMTASKFASGLLATPKRSVRGSRSGWQLSLVELPFSYRTLGSTIDVRVPPCGYRRTRWFPASAKGPWHPAPARQRAVHGTRGLPAVFCRRSTLPLVRVR